MSAEYVYDGLGRRAICEYGYPDSGGGNLTSYYLVYDGVKPIEKRSLVDNHVMERYYHGPGLNNPLRVDKFAANGVLAGSYDLICDDRGTVIGVVNATTGQIIEKLFYNSTGLCKAYYANGMPKTHPQ